MYLCKMLFLCVLLAVTCQSQNPTDIALQLAWKGIQKIYEDWTWRPEPAPIPLLVFYDDMSGMNHMLPVLWDEDIDVGVMKKTPFQVLMSAVPEVIQGYPKQVDVSRCSLFYKLGDDGIVQINDDDQVANMLQSPPDYEGNHRRIFVECPEVSNEECRNSQCHADASSSGGAMDDKYDNTHYQLALNAYRHAKGQQMEIDESKVEQYEEELEELGLSGFTVRSQAVQLFYQSLDSYNEGLEEMAQSFNWDEQTLATAKAAAHASVANKADKNISFNQETWTLTGYIERFASWIDEANNLISYVVSTSTFEFKVPQNQRDQTFYGKFISGEGEVKKSFVKRINLLMRADLIEDSKDNLPAPIMQQFRKQIKQ